jgi:hypothetical protein
MFGLKRRRYWRDVETNLSYLIAFDEAYLRKLIASFDGLKRSAENMRQQGKSPLEAAIELWTIMFSYEIERSPQLRDDRKKIEEYIFENVGDWKFDTERAMKVFLINTDKHARVGTVPKEAFDYAVSEIVGALDGVSRDDRSTLRIQALTAKLGAGSDDP